MLPHQRLTIEHPNFQLFMKFFIFIFMVFHKMAYIFIQIFGVPHSWKDYIYSLSTLYNVSKPFAIFELISVFPATHLWALGFLSQLIRLILFLGNLIPTDTDFTGFHHYRLLCKSAVLLTDTTRCIRSR